MLNVQIPVIGTLKTPHHTISHMPIQPAGAKGIQGQIYLDKSYEDGLKDLAGFSHIILVYHFHKVNRVQLTVKPFMDDAEHGIFATRSPLRPSKIGMSIVRLIQVKNNIVYFDGTDMLNDTPLLDIKPFFRQMDNVPEAVSGWLDQKADELASTMRSDDRFA